MAIDQTQLAEFQGKLKELLKEYKYQLVVCPVFVDGLNNKHPIPVGSGITADLQVKEEDETPNGTH